MPKKKRRRSKSTSASRPAETQLPKWVQDEVSQSGLVISERMRLFIPKVIVPVFEQLKQAHKQILKACEPQMSALDRAREHGAFISLYAPPLKPSSDSPAKKKTTVRNAVILELHAQNLTAEQIRTHPKMRQFKSLSKSQINRIIPGRNRKK